MIAVEIAAIVLNVLGLAIIVSTYILKKASMKQILLLIFLANLMVATSYLLAGDGINGAVSGYMACVMTIINYFFQARKKPIPKWLIGIYAVSFVAVNLIISEFNVFTVLAIGAALFFVASIVQSGGKGYRLCSVGNSVLWSAYDILTGSYGALLTHGSLLAVTLGSVLLYDVWKKKK